MSSLLSGLAVRVAEQPEQRPRRVAALQLCEVVAQGVRLGVGELDVGRTVLLDVECLHGHASSLMSAAMSRMPSRRDARWPRSAAAWASRDAMPELAIPP